MSRVVVAMSMSLDGIAGPESADADGMAVFSAILGWQFPLRSWRKEQGMDGGEDSVDSRVWAENFARFGPQIVGRTMFDYGYPNWGENPPFHAPVFVVTHRGQERIEKSGGTSYTFVTGGIKAAVEQARAVAEGKDVLVAGGVSVARQAERSVSRAVRWAGEPGTAAVLAAAAITLSVVPAPSALVQVTRAAAMTAGQSYQARSVARPSECGRAGRAPAGHRHRRVRPRAGQGPCRWADKASGPGASSRSRSSTNSR